MGSDAVALFVGARLTTRSNDTHYRFRQDSDFWYLTGFDHPHALAVLRTDGGPAYTLFVQPRDPGAETWTGYRPGIEGAMQDYGADQAKSIDDLMKELPELTGRAKRIFHALGRDQELDHRLVEVLNEQRLRSRMGIDPASEIVDPRSIVHEMRLYKEEHELEIMRRAQDITCEGHSLAAALAQPDRSEHELEAILDYTFRRRGGSGPAYTSIVGGGANAAILHYVVNDQPLRDGELVLIDAGAELEGYAADVTRTYPVGGHFEGPGLAVYEVVLSAQEAALSACRPGVTLDEIHGIAVRSLCEGLLQLGLLSGSIDEIVAKESYRPYYMHRTSHWLGLDVHDVGSYSRDGKPRKVEPGMVLTIEPGLYLQAQAEISDPRFRGIGVRLEDDIVITADGFENLSAQIPKSPDDVSAWVKSS